jgi:hypothetical protein
MIIRYKVPLTLDVSSSSTVVTSGVLPVNGILRGISSYLPTLDGAATYTVTVQDEDLVAIYNKATITSNTTTTAFVDTNNYYFQLPIVKATIKLTASGAQSTDKIGFVVLFVQI